MHTGLYPDFLIKNEDGTINVVRSLDVAIEWNIHDFLINSFIQREAPAHVLRTLDHTICIGHVPTCFLDIQMPIITAMPGNRVILTDCGAGHGERLGCLRIDDEATFYV